MTEEAQKPVAPVAVSEVPVAESTPAPVPEPEVPAAKATETAVEVAVEETEEEKTKAVEIEKAIAQSVSFKEESYVVGDLPESQRKALDELKQMVRDALDKREFAEPKKEEKKEEEAEKKEEEAVKTETAAPESEAVALAVTEEPKKEEEKATEPTKEAEKAPEPTPEPKKEAEKTLEPTPEPKKEAEKAPEPTPEPKKEAEKAPEPTPEAKKEPEPTPPAASVSAAVAVVEEKVTVTAEDDGAKTVEAIEETVVVSAEEPKKEEEEAKESEAAVEPEEIEIWGIPLLQDERSDVVLLKFLRAREYKPKEAFAMLKNTVRWRKQFGIEALLGEDNAGAHLSEAAFCHGVDKEGHSVCYNVFGAFQDKELYQKTFGDSEKRSDFIKWRILFLEKSIRKFDFSPNGISTIVQVNDFKNFPGLLKGELKQGTEQALKLLQDNYPEFVAKQVFINVPWWYLAFHKVISTFLTQRTKSKLVLVGPSKSAETLFKYIAPEQVPVQYGGLSREENTEFATSDAVTQVLVKPASKHIVEIPVDDKVNQVDWEIRVTGWEVTYGAEFVPAAEDHYTVILQKARKVGSSDETVISNSFKVTEPGKIVLTVDNQTSKKKLVLYRYKAKPSLSCQ